MDTIAEACPRKIYVAFTQKVGLFAITACERENRFRAQDSSSCCTYRGETDLEKVADEDWELVGMGKTEVAGSAEGEKMPPQEASKEKCFEIYALGVEDRTHMPALVVVPMAMPQRGQKSLPDNCSSCDGDYVEVIRSCLSIYPAIVEGYPPPTDVKLVVRVV